MPTCKDSVKTDLSVVNEGLDWIQLAQDESSDELLVKTAFLTTWVDFYTS